MWPLSKSTFMHSLLPLVELNEMNPLSCTPSFMLMQLWESVSDPMCLQRFHTQIQKNPTHTGDHVSATTVWKWSSVGLLVTWPADQRGVIMRVCPWVWVSVKNTLEPQCWPSLTPPPPTWTLRWCSDNFMLLLEDCTWYTSLCTSLSLPLIKLVSWLKWYQIRTICAHCCAR